MYVREFYRDGCGCSDQQYCGNVGAAMRDNEPNEESSSIPALLLLGFILWMGFLLYEAHKIIFR